ncbi:MAG: N-acetyltransferase [Gammaproteobacteria bacterium]|nr:N-acetyltransferase [Gammaproteobacteria bacterium]
MYRCGMRSTLISSMSDVSRDAWNALDGTHTPFLRHEFLSALEKHGCVGEATGWTPQHVLLFDADNNLVGAVPQYLKHHSYGELVFDWAWADAFQRSGLRYYPKLVAAIPYTPASGPRLLVTPGAERGTVASALVRLLIENAQRQQLSSLHCLFPHGQDRSVLASQGLLVRMGCQFHWHNDHYRDFDDFLARLTARKRKKIRRERRAVAESGVTLHRLLGEQLTDTQWQAVHRHYVSTYERLGGYATLSRAFFQEVSHSLPGQLLVIVAEHPDAQDGLPVASAICFRDADTLYGRHWGCDAHFDNLHFEVCYYQGLEYCIEQGLRRFDPGAQGEHKISRGFLPTPTWSCHWIADPEFRVAIEDFLCHETRGMEHYIESLGEHSPFK